MLRLVVVVAGGSITVSGPAFVTPPPPSEATNVTGKCTPGNEIIVWCIHARHLVTLGLLRLRVLKMQFHNSDMPVKYRSWWLAAECLDLIFTAV